MATEQASHADEAARLVEHAESVRHSLTAALARLDQWSDAIAEVDQQAYARNLLGVLASAHEATSSERQTLALYLRDTGILSTRAIASALGVNPGTITKWADPQ
ncbi:hypothetical protein ACTXMW_17245 [Brachybacterium paraconglomeratum]|uniref:hypothetical protein n=1 Tax=Brachybacterium paraconglomeratum TaxID=173362 RepID=UPI003FCEE80C